MDKNKRREIILSKLLLGEIINTTKLAKQLGVSKRTILNDIKEIQIAHELVSDKKGYYKLKEIPSFMEDEIKEVLENLIYSLAFYSFEGFKEEIKRFYNKEFLIEFDTYFEEIKNLTFFKYLLQALKWGHSLEIEYKGVKKTIHPLKIANYFGYWYLIGIDLAEDKIKTFLINKIENICLLCENLYGDTSKIKKSLKPLVKDEVKSVKLKIYSPYRDFISKKVPINSSILEVKDDYVLVEFFYYVEEEAFDFIKRYIPNVEIMDKELKKKFKEVLKSFLEK